MQGGRWKIHCWYLSPLISWEEINSFIQILRNVSGRTTQADFCLGHFLFNLAQVEGSKQYYHKNSNVYVCILLYLMPFQRLARYESNLFLGLGPKLFGGKTEHLVVWTIDLHLKRSFNILWIRNEGTSSAEWRFKKTVPNVMSLNSAHITFNIFHFLFAWSLSDRVYKVVLLSFSFNSPFRSNPRLVWCVHVGWRIISSANRQTTIFTIFAQTNGVHTCLIRLAQLSVCGVLISLKKECLKEHFQVCILNTGDWHGYLISASFLLVYWILEGSIGSVTNSSQ